MRRLIALLLLAAALGACGSRGSLYLPPPPGTEDDVSAPKAKRR
jgi:predicted small lipoprotein YifL